MPNHHSPATILTVIKKGIAQWIIRASDFTEQGPYHSAIVALQVAALEVWAARKRGLKGELFVQDDHGLPRLVGKARARPAPRERVCSSLRAVAKQSTSVAQHGLLRRGACHRAGHFGPDPLAPRNDESRASGAARTVSRVYIRTVNARWRGT